MKNLDLYIETSFFLHTHNSKKRKTIQKNDMIISQILQLLFQFLVCLYNRHKIYLYIAPSSIPNAGQCPFSREIIHKCAIVFCSIHLKILQFQMILIRIGT
jgi:hypothetical protein